MRRQTFFGLALTAIASVANAQPAGPEFRVNGITVGWQYQPALASDADGNFVVVWASDGVDGYATGIVGRRYDRLGNPRGNEFVVNTFSGDYQIQPSVAVHSSGAFVVTWQSYGELGTYGDIFAQRFDVAGSRVGLEFQVNTVTAYDQRDPDVAYGSAGEFVIVWTSYESDTYGGYANVSGQRYDSAGNAAGGEFLVNTTARDFDGQPAVAMLPAGGFAVVWEGYPDAPAEASGVFGQRFNAAGVALGAEFLVNTHTTNTQRDPDIAVDGAGNFVVVWDSFSQDEAPASDPGIFGQLFAANGDRQGVEFQANTYVTETQRSVAVAREANGDFVVTWQSSNQIPFGIDVFAQRFGATGTRIGLEFQVNTYTTGNQDNPVIASLAQEKFVVAWTSWDQDGSGAGVFAQRFGDLDLIFRNGFNGGP